MPIGGKFKKNQRSENVVGIFVFNKLRFRFCGVIDGHIWYIQIWLYYKRKYDAILYPYKLSTLVIGFKYRQLSIFSVIYIDFMLSFLDCNPSHKIYMV